jgi:hypothetical protein
MEFFQKINKMLAVLFDTGAEKYDNSLINLAFEWQTLITAAIAGLPAAVAAWLLWRQVDDQRKENRRVKQQQQIAARIKMPHALADLSEYWKHCFQAIISEDLSKKTDVLPVGALETIMAAAPTVEAETFEIMRRLVTTSQVFESRFRSAQARPTSNIIPTLLVDVAKLDFHTDSLYEFARFETDTVNVQQPDRMLLSKQIYHGLDINVQYCAAEAKKMIVESALNTEFRAAARLRGGK